MRRRTQGSIIAAARRAEALGLAIGSTGNVSVRDGDRIFITPSQVPYESLRRRDICEVTIDGLTVRGRGPSRELSLHLAVYLGRGDVGAVVHAHGPCATAWSFSAAPLLPEIEELAYYEIGPVRTCRPEPAGSLALGRALLAALGTSKAALLAGHGLVAVGADLAEALVIARAVEHQARVAWLVRGRERSDHTLLSLVSA